VTLALATARASRKIQVQCREISIKYSGALRNGTPLCVRFCWPAARPRGGTGSSSRSPGAPGSRAPAASSPGSPSTGTSPQARSPPPPPCFSDLASHQLRTEPFGACSGNASRLGRSVPSTAAAARRPRTGSAGSSPSAPCARTPRR